MDKPLDQQGRPVRKAKGVRAELAVAVELLNHGFSASWPFGDIDGYDLIADSGGRLTRLQVKSAYHPSERGTYKISFRKGKRHSHTYSTTDCDYIVAVLWYPDTTAYYVIPVDKATSSGTFFQPNKHPRHPERWKTCALEEYRSRWDLLR